MSGAPLAVFRADASPALGLGHVRRCLALAEALRLNGWTAALACSGATIETMGSASLHNLDVLALDGAPDDEPAAMARRWSAGATLMVVDHYHRDAAWQGKCRGWADAVLAVEDFDDRTHDAEFLLDQTVGAAADVLAKQNARTGRVLAGPAFALLRPDFFRRRYGAGLRDRSGPVRRIFMSLGGTDPNDASSKVLDAIESIASGVAIDVAISSAAPAAKALASRRGGVRVHVDHPDLAELMSEADVAIGAGGVTALERCVAGLPSVVVTVADNQSRVARGLADSGAAIVVPSLRPDVVATALQRLIADAPTRIEMSRRAASLCDGLGARRVALAIERRPIMLRPARADDKSRLLDWQREPDSRRFARNPAVPTSTEHSAWFTARLSDPKCLLHIVETAEGDPAGMLRLDHIGPLRFEVSILIAGRHRGGGVGLNALQWVRRLLPEAEFHANILPANQASLRLFERAGYVRHSGDWFVSRP